MTEHKDTIDILAITADRRFYRKKEVYLALTSMRVPKYLARLPDMLPVQIFRCVSECDVGLILLDDMYVPILPDEITSRYKYTENPKDTCVESRELLDSSSLVVNYNVEKNTYIAILVTPCCGCVTCHKVSMSDAYIVMYEYHLDERNRAHCTYMDAYKVSKFMLKIALSTYSERDMITCPSYYVVHYLYRNIPDVSSYDEMKKWLTKESGIFRMCAPTELRRCTWLDMSTVMLAKAKLEG
jgi:hypothetical protein